MLDQDKTRTVKHCTKDCGYRSWLQNNCMIIGSLVACALVAAPASEAEAQKYSGAIDSHYSVNMILEQNGKALAGSYGYNSASTSLKLTGTIDGDGRFSMDESDPKGKKTGSFSGRLVKGNRLVGAWTDAARKKQMPFILARVGSASALDGGVDGIIITQKIKKVRKAPGSMVPEAVISYPVVDTKFIPDPALAKRIVNALSGAPIYGDSISVMEENTRGGDTWLNEASYVIDYNRNCLLDGDFTISGCGAYPDEHTIHVLLNLKTGKSVKVSEAFAPASLKTLEQMVKKKIDGAVAKAIKEHKEDLTDPDETSEMYSLDPKVKLLEQFSVSDTGVTFLHDWGFPHATQALEPENRFFLPFDSIKTFIRKDGPLAAFVK